MTNIKSKFNPVKEETGDQASQRVIWTTEIIEIARQALEKGKRLKANPFYDGNKVKLLKPDLVYERTDWEIAEWKKCEKDELYFANTYAQVMTPQGVQHIKLRDYQEEYLKLCNENKLTICLAARQIGKCNSLLMKVLIKIDEKNTKFSLPALKNDTWSKFYTGKNNEFEIPLFELYNLFASGWKWRIKYHLYKLLWRTQGNSTLSYNIIHQLDKWSEKVPDGVKFTESIPLYGIEVLSYEGWQPVTSINITKAYDLWEMVTTNHTLQGADHHLVYKRVAGNKYGTRKVSQPCYDATRMSDLNVGDRILTNTGEDEVLSVYKVGPSIQMADLAVASDSHTFWSNGILSHNTITSAIDLIHFICFNFDKLGVVFGNIGKTAKEILTKAKSIFEELPYFLKPGIEKWNESEIVLDNGCRIKAAVTTKTPNLGDTVHWCLWDEAAHVDRNIVDVFYKQVFPTITASNGIFRITSTQNGYNKFAELYMAAEAGDSDYSAFKVDWYQVPNWNEEKQCWEKRDEKWRRRMIANIGSEEGFNEQYGTEFIISSNTLLSRKFIAKHEKEIERFVNKDIPGVMLSESWFWKPDFEPMDNLKNEYLIFTCDLAEGLGQDDNIYSCWRLIDNGVPAKVGYFKNNTNSREECAESFCQLLSMHCNPMRYLISVEWNTYGELFIKELTGLEDKYTNFSRDNFVKYYTGENNEGKYRLGIKITPGNKTPHCQLFKEDFEAGKIIDTCYITHSQFKNFGDVAGPSSPQKRYAALFGHDDMVMSDIQLMFVKETLQWTIFVEDYKAHAQVEEDEIYNPYEILDVVPRWDPVEKTEDNYYNRLRLK